MTKIEVASNQDPAPREVKPHARRGVAIFKQKNPVAALVVGLIILAAVLGIKYYNAQKITDQLTKNPKSAAQSAINKTVAEVGKIAILPNSGEVPTLATVTDVTQLKSQDFFASAQNGDKVLIYTKAQIAILYRPSVNKIVNIGPVNIKGATGTTPSGG